MKENKILEEIMSNAQQVPLECQERILDILKGMVFTKKCLINSLSQENEKEKDETNI